MQNQMMKNNLYESIKMSEDELYHHGVLNMSWGERNGPPYPLTGKAKRIAKEEYKKKVEREKRLEKMRKTAAKKRKLEKKEKIHQEKIEKMKKKLIEKGDIEKINKNAKHFTNEELRTARERNAELIEMRYSKSAKKAPNPHAFESFINIVDRVGQVAAKTVPIITAVEGLKRIQKMDLDRKMSEMDKMDAAVRSKISILKDIDPDAAARFASRTLGTTVEYKKDGKTEEERKREKEDREKKEIEDRVNLLMKVNPEAAATYLSEKTGKTIQYKQSTSAKDKATLVQEINKMINQSTDDDEKREYRKKIVEILNS